jgi:hypothetical protein
MYQPPPAARSKRAAMAATNAMKPKRGFNVSAFL